MKSKDMCVCNESVWTMEMTDPCCLCVCRTEDCDDGNLLDGDGCSKKCHMESGFNCNGE